MRADLLVMAADLAKRETPFVMAVVVGRRAPSSAQVGNMALITPSGQFHGWLGGSCTRESVEREARLALAEGTPRLLKLLAGAEEERRPGVSIQAMTCTSGGSADIYLEPIMPVPRLVIFGDSPIADALARLGRAAGYAVVPAETAGGTRLPTGPCSIVVATMGTGDEEAIAAALALCPTYLGVVASRPRFAEMRSALLAQGIAEASLDAIKSPAGLAIGAHRPEDIAISVLAEIVQQRSTVSASPEVESSLHAKDPVCHMTVETASARHTTVHEDRTYYFCCVGCRAKFMANPEQYA